MDPVTDSGGRVTRALRKRLTSIDSENSSRPGTPVQSKLTATTNSPLKSRMTRRHSTSGLGGTPVKTPSKRAGNAVSTIAEVVEANVTPAKRTTRRRSVSQIENGATPKLELKTSNFETLAEEEAPMRVTRSHSKSPPNQVNVDIEGDGKVKTAGRLRRSIRKDVGNLSPTTRENVHVVDVEKEELNAPQQKRKSLNSDTNVIKSVPGHEEVEQASNRAFPENKSASNGAEATNEASPQRMDIVETVHIEEENTPSTYDNNAAALPLQKDFDVEKNEEETVTKSPSKEDIAVKSFGETAIQTMSAEIDEENNEVLKSEENKPHVLDNSTGEILLNVETVQSPEGSFTGNGQNTVPEIYVTSPIAELLPQNLVGEGEILNIEVTGKSRRSSEMVFKTPSPTKKSQTATNEHLVDGDTITPIRNTKGRCLIVNSCESDVKKSVAFSNLSDNEIERSIYPKTPASSKNKNITEKSVLDSDDKSFQGNGNVTVVSISDTTDMESPQKEQGAIHSTQCLKTCASPGVVGENDVVEKTNTTPKESGKYIDVKVSESVGSELKWRNPSVMAEGTKLDTIEKKMDNVDKPISEHKTEKKKNKLSFLKRNEWNDDESLCEEEDVELNEEGEELKPYVRKHDFHDDEVMVVDDYESGDSMDSEERREMVENEILVDGVSIGSHTTDEDDYVDEEDSENDSFIVSDNYDEEDQENNNCSEIESDDGERENNAGKSNSRDNEKRYKRIQRISESSSSDEEKMSIETKAKEGETLQNGPTSAEVRTLNCSMLSESALRLQSESEDELHVSNAENSANMSRQEILRKMNQSDRFNKSVRDINMEVDVSPDALANSDSTLCIDSENLHGIPIKLSTSESIVSTTGANKEVLDKTVDESDDARLDDGEPTSTSGNVSESELNVGSKFKSNAKTLPSSKHSESHLGEVSVTSEDEVDNVAESTNDENDSNEDNYKENEVVPKTKGNRGLSVSFGNFKQQKNETPLEKKLLRRSFTIGVSVNGRELQAAVLKKNVLKSTDLESSSPSASLSSNEETDGNVLSSDDVRYLENMKHMPLGNPLVRTRRQSLALPTNPDMEICSIQHCGAAPNQNSHKRKSLAVLSGNEFYPSQSFVDSLELRKAEIGQQTSKRKRLSKSFCGTADNSIIDIDVRHLHKRSKLASDKLLADSTENLKCNNSLCTKVAHSSTPYDKDSKKLNNSGVRRILNRCDEILEAANRAKLEAKINFKKSQIRLPKKNKKRIQQKTSESDRDKKFPPKNKDIKKSKDSAKIAVKQALKASANIIIGKHRKNVEETKEISSDIYKSDAEKQPTTTKQNTKCHLTEQSVKLRNYATAAGNVVEMLQSPKRKKKSKYIQLPTGKVCVEPLTPAKRSILTCNGLEFHESPMTPCAIGFKVRDVLPSNTDATTHFSHIRKRKRNAEEKKRTYPTPQWTQSGLFMEEEIPFAAASRHHNARVPKGADLGHQSKNLNFKQCAMHRGDIKRTSAREMLQLRERRQLYE